MKRAYIKYAVYACLIAAVLVFRTTARPNTEGESLLASLSVALILGFTTLGPAWLGEHLRSRLAPVLPVARELKVNRAHLKMKREKHNRAVVYLADVDNRQRHWEEEAQKLKARYDLGYARHDQLPPNHP